MVVQRGGGFNKILSLQMMTTIMMMTITMMAPYPISSIGQQHRSYRSTTYYLYPPVTTSLRIAHLSSFQLFSTLIGAITGCREQACNACTCRTALNCRTAMDLDGTTHFTLIAYRSSLKEFVTSMVIE